MPSQEPVIVGRFGAPYGIKGWLRVTSYTDPADNIREYQPWLVDTGQGFSEVEVCAFRVLSKGFAAQLAGVVDRDEAAEWRGREISVEAARLPAPEPGEIYWKDLIGLAAHAPDGAPLGRVSGLVPGGSHDVLVIDLVSAGKPVMVPFHRDYVPEVDIEAGRLVADISELQD